MIKKSSIALIFSLTAITWSCNKTECTAALKENCACILLYDPVCGCDNKTYGNSCEADCNSITEYVKGECKK